MAKRRKKLVIRDSRRTFGRLALVLLAALVLVGAALAAVFFAKSCGVLLSTRSLPFGSASKYVGTEDGILYLRGGALNFYSFEDEDLNYTLPLANEPEGIVGSRGIKAVHTDNTVQIIDAPFNIELDGSIERVLCGSKNIAVYKRRPDDGYELRIYNTSGQQVLQLPGTLNGQEYYSYGRLVDFGFSEARGSVLWTMELDTSSGTPRTTITTFDLDRMTNSGIITVQGQLVERVFFTDSSIFVVGTESLIRYGASDNREKYRVQVYGYRVEDMSLSGSRPTMLLSPREGGENAGMARLLTVSEKDVAGETAVSVRLPEGAVGCKMVNGMLAVVTANDVRLYNTSGDQAELLGFNEIAITSCEKLDEHHILLERSGEYSLLTVGK
ncbi:MAG: hypothetical protein J6P98_00170 [Clostridia bacterium]|nr:hypothetical protein [Clostridia bacterium]